VVLVRVLLLPVAVAALVAALVGAGWLGLVLATAAGESTTPAPAARSAAAKPRDAKRPRRHARPWADRATTVCNRAYEQTLDAIDLVVLDSPDLTTRQRNLELLTRALEIESRTLTALGALRPRPRPDHRTIRDALRLFRGVVADDRGTASLLRRRWSRSLLVRRSAAQLPVNERLNILFLGLGASGCATYFDPDSYS